MLLLKGGFLFSVNFIEVHELLRVFGVYSFIELDCYSLGMIYLVRLYASLGSYSMICGCGLVYLKFMTLNR